MSGNDRSGREENVAGQRPRPRRDQTLTVTSPRPAMLGRSRDGPGTRIRLSGGIKDDSSRHARRCASSVDLPSLPSRRPPMPKHGPASPIRVAALCRGRSRSLAAEQLPPGHMNGGMHSNGGMPPPTPMSEDYRRRRIRCDRHTARARCCNDGAYGGSGCYDDGCCDSCGGYGCDGSCCYRGGWAAICSAGAARRESTTSPPTTCTRGPISARRSRSWRQQVEIRARRRHRHVSFARFRLRIVVSLWRRIPPMQLRRRNPLSVHAA